MRRTPIGGIYSSQWHLKCLNFTIVYSHGLRKMNWHQKCRTALYCRDPSGDSGDGSYLADGTVRQARRRLIGWRTRWRLEGSQAGKQDCESTAPPGTTKNWPSFCNMSKGDRGRPWLWRPKKWQWTPETGTNNAWQKYTKTVLLTGNFDNFCLIRVGGAGLNLSQGDQLESL